jgi:hypothetical protein
MTKERTQNKVPEEHKLNNIWSYIIYAITIFGAGYGAGNYLSSLNSKIEKQQIVLEYQEKLTDLKNQNILLQVKIERNERSK